MIVYRLSKLKYANDLSGSGSKIHGGRWNSRGKSMLYTAQSIALCVVEVAVHLPLGFIPPDYSLVAIHIPDSFEVKPVLREQLPLNWAVSLHGQHTQEIGDEFLLNCKYLTFKVPSAVIHGEYNYLINPIHPDFNKVKIESIQPFSFDNRLFVR